MGARVKIQLTAGRAVNAAAGTDGLAGFCAWLSRRADSLALKTGIRLKRQRYLAFAQPNGLNNGGRAGSFACFACFAPEQRLLKVARETRATQQPQQTGNNAGSDAREQGAAL